MSVAKRLTKIESSLPPRQAVLLWLKEMRQSSLSIFLEKLSNRHETPLIRLPEMAARAVRERFNQNGIMPESAKDVEREAWRQAALLVVIAVRLNLTVLADRRSKWFCKVLLHEWLYRMLLESMHTARYDCATATVWRMLLTDALREARQLRETIAVISATYFDGQSLLVSELEIHLNQHIQELEGMANAYKTPAPLASCMAIDLMALESSIKVQVPIEVANRVACAEAEVLQLPGQPGAPWERLQPFAGRVRGMGSF